MTSQILLLISAMKTYIIFICSIILAFLIPIQPLILSVGAFIFADTIIGIWRAKKKGEKITSRRLSNIVSKMLLYESALILFFVLERFVVGDFIILFTTIPFFLSKVLAATLCGIEIKSIDESFTSITGVSIWDKFKALLRRAKEGKDEIKDLMN